MSSELNKHNSEDITQDIYLPWWWFNVQTETLKSGKVLSCGGTFSVVGTHQENSMF